MKTVGFAGEGAEAMRLKAFVEAESAMTGRATVSVQYVYPSGFLFRFSPKTVKNSLGKEEISKIFTSNAGVTLRTAGT